MVMMTAPEIRHTIPASSSVLIPSTCTAPSISGNCLYTCGAFHHHRVHNEMSVPHPLPYPGLPTPRSPFHHHPSGSGHEQPSPPSDYRHRRALAACIAVPADSGCKILTDPSPLVLRCTLPAERLTYHHHHGGNALQDAEPRRPLPVAMRATEKVQLLSQHRIDLVATAVGSIGQRGIRDWSPVMLDHME